MAKVKVEATSATIPEAAFDVDREIKSLSQRVTRSFYDAMQAVVIDQLVRQEPA